MATKIITKNSSTATAIPTAGDLVQGELAVNVTDKRLFTEDSGGAIVELGTNPSTLTVTGEIAANGGIALGDNDKATFGDGDDLQIYSDGSSSYIEESGPGPLFIRSNGSGVVIEGDDLDNLLFADTLNDSVKLYADGGNLKLATTATGIDVTGTVTADGLTITTATPSIQMTDSDNNADAYIQGTDGNIRFYADDNNEAASSIITFNIDGGEKVRITDAGNVGIGTSSPARLLDIKDSSNLDGGRLRLRSATAIDTYPTIGSVEFYSDDNSASSSGIVGSIDVEGIGAWNGSSNNAAMTFNLIQGLAGTTSPVEAMRIDASGNLGIGTSLPSAGIPLTAYYSSTSQMHLGGAANIVSNNTYFNGTAWVNRNSAVGGAVLQINTDGSFAFRRAGTGASPTLNYSALIDASGNLLVGKTASNSTVSGSQLNANGLIIGTTSGTNPLLLNRLSTDGGIAVFQRQGATIGSIGAQGGIVYVTGPLAGGLKYSNYDSTHASIFPCTTIGGIADNLHDLGYSGSRFDNIWATNGTIQTSDRNEKQDIEELSSAETAVAVACKRLLRKFRWIDAVEKKGDDARIHFGIIAQDLQAAFAAEGLDAGRYAMFTSNTWWETQTEVEAVEAVEFVQAVEAVYNEDGELVSEAVEGVEAVEAKDAYIRTDTFATLEEAPEGATERTRLGVRYPELLAFIIAAI